MSEQPPAERPERLPGFQKAGPGRGNKWEPTEDEKMAAFCLAAMGASAREIGFHLHHDQKLIQERMGPLLEMGDKVAAQTIKAKLFRKALGSGIHSSDGETAALIYLAKVRLGWYDRPPAFGPVHPNDIPATSQATREELSVTVTYRRSNDPQALPPPPADRLPNRMLEAEAEPR